MRYDRAPCCLRLCLSEAGRPTEALSYRSLPRLLSHLGTAILISPVDGVLDALLIRSLSMSILMSCCASLDDDAFDADGLDDDPFDADEAIRARMGCASLCDDAFDADGAIGAGMGAAVLVGKELGPAAKRVAATPPAVVPWELDLTGLLGGGGGIGDNLLISTSGGTGVHFPVSLLCACDGEPCAMPDFDRVAITAPFSVVSILNDPLAGGGGVILTCFGELIMMRVWISAYESS